MVSSGKALARSAQELLADYVATGAQAPFEEIVRRYAGMVFNVCYQILHDSHDAEDATQAVFLALAVQAKTANGVKYLAPWLQKVAQRLALDVRRSKTRRKVREEKHGQMQEQRIGQGHDHTQTADLDELKVILRDELDKLPAKYRLPLVLHYFGGLKPEEISKELGCKASTLGVRLHRGRKMLADILAERGIIVNGSILAIALASCVQSRITETLIYNTCTAAGSYASAGSFGTAVSTQVVGFNRLANQGIFFAKVKAAVATGILAAAVAAGAAELVSRVAPLNLRFDLRTDFNELLKPVMRSLTPKSHADASNALSSDAVKVALSPAAVDPLHVWTPLPPVQTSSSSETASGSGFTGGIGNVAQSSSMRSAEISDPRDLPFPSPAPSARRSTDSDLPDPVTRVATKTVESPLSLAASSGNTAVYASSGSGGGGGSASSVAYAAATPPPPITISRAATATSSFSLFHGNSGQISIGSGLGENASVTLDKDNTVTTRELKIGDKGSGTLTQAMGTVSASDVRIAAGYGSEGNYIMDGPASLYANTLEVGSSGVGCFKLAGEAFAELDSFVVGNSGSGSVQIEGGRLNGRSIVIASRGNAVVNQTSGTTRAFGLIGDLGALQIASTRRSQGTYNLQGGSLEAANQIIGQLGLAELHQSGGTNTVRNLELGAGVSADGTYNLRNGKLLVQRSDEQSPVKNKVTVGVQGRGMLRLGGIDTPGLVQESGVGAATDLVVRAQPSAIGVIRGWGQIGLSGQLEQNGQVIADGLGDARTLDLSRFSSVVNTIENNPGEPHGWQARRGGRLQLPVRADDGSASPVVSRITWGESADDPTLDLVNSARFGFIPSLDASQPVNISLLAADNPFVPGAPQDVSLLSVYETNFSSLPLESVLWTVRYDGAVVTEDELKVLTWRDGHWTIADSGALTIDPASQVLSLFATPANFYAIGTTGTLLDLIAPMSAGVPGVVPEPGTISLLTLGAALLIPRRRSRTSSR